MTPKSFTSCLRRRDRCARASSRRARIYDGTSLGMRKNTDGHTFALDVWLCTGSVQGHWIFQAFWQDTRAIVAQLVIIWLMLSC